MGRICPILNHPLKDGLLVDDDALVKFIQKRNVDFLPNELVCRSCKREIIKLYNKKLKKAIELHKSRLHEGSISSYKTSSRASTISENSLTINGSRQSVQHEVTQNGRASNTSTRTDQNISKTNSITQNNNHSEHSFDKSHKKQATEISEIQQNQNNVIANIPTQNGKEHVTIRKRTIKDFLTVKPKTTTETTKNPQSNKPDEAAHISYSSEEDDDVVRRLSQQPGTSKAVANTNSKATVNSNKRPISAIVDSDDDDERLSLNAYNGTRLPHVQPFPPKRKSNPAATKPLGYDIMNDYIKDVTGG
ncbi:altered inheritance of mitochondria protein 21-like [Lucilia sericata]|uniref:altered inheritance of mitochondria protein 21-like n=1 Tax=Lucilia sericata TaxID=13632 RepID=UPI0018A86557|nr:altered inheritance of mitochondria protein 21-like [Lucilia sericata]